MFQNNFDFFLFRFQIPLPLLTQNRISERFVVHQQLKCRTLPLSSILGNDRTSNPNR